MTKKNIRLASDQGAEDAALAINTKVSLDKRGFFEQMGDVYEEDLFPRDWTKTEIEKAASELIGDRRFTAGFWQQIPAMCRNDCKHKDECRLSKKPTGQRCPEEIAFLELLMRKYMHDLNVTMDDITSVSLIRDLCDIEIQLMRKQGILANEDLILDEPILDARGNPTDYVRRVENPAIGTQAKLWRDKNAILKNLVADRASRLKAQNDQNRGDDMSQAVRALKQIREAIDSGKLNNTAAEDEFKDAFIDMEDADIVEITEPEPEE